MKSIPKEVIDEIEQRSNISDIIGSYVSLQRAGTNLKGLCPFHSEKTPSFVVYPNSNSFYCFGCGAGGSVFTFIMKAENTDFYGAVQILAERAGIKIPDTYDSDNSEKQISRKRVYEINLDAAKYFRQCLFDNNTGSKAAEYVFGQRKLSNAVVKHFGLGYAPDSFGDFINYMHKLGYNDAELADADLATYSEKSKKYYSRFRNRVMFPIIDTSGNVIAFGGRVLDDSKPKYLNSSDTPGFKKSRNLFALNYAKNNCSECLILCEGYMDVIALHANGFENAVATLGTAITSEQARLISRYTKKVILIYDSDEAGRKADERAMRLLGEVGVDVKVLKLEGAKDPDEYFKKYGAESFKRAITNSKNGFVHKMDTIIDKYNIADSQEKINAIKEVVNEISGISSDVERDVYIHLLSEKLGIAEDSVKSDVERLRKKKTYEYRKNESKNAIGQAKRYGDVINSDAAKNVTASSAEDIIIGIMLSDEVIRTKAVNNDDLICEEDFFTEFGKKVFRLIKECQNSAPGFSKNLLQQSLSADEYGRIVRFEQIQSEYKCDRDESFSEAISTLKKEKELKTAESNGDKFANILLKRKQNNK